MRDRHHLLHTKKNWESDPLARRLRDQPSLIFTVDRTVHEELHRETPPIPLLGHYALLGTLDRYTPTFDPTRDIDGLCLAMDRATKHPKTHRLERELAGLAIEGLQLEKNFIYEGIIA